MDIRLPAYSSLPQSAILRPLLIPSSDRKGPGSDAVHVLQRLSLQQHHERLHELGDPHRPIRGRANQYNTSFLDTAADLKSQSNDGAERVRTSGLGVKINDECEDFSQYTKSKPVDIVGR